jgi:hypothetical protein
MSKSLNTQIIERARALIANEHNWCRGRAAIDLSGNQVHPADARARRRCPLGAFIAAAHEIARGPAMAEELAYDAVWSFTSPTTLFTVNDLWGHAAVLRRLDKAIAAS